jgi:alpha-beta hydrolase superfamily lysophospholipase
MSDKVARPNQTPPSLARKCGKTFGVVARPMWLRTSDHLRLYAIEAGRGASAVILLHETPATLCGWLPFVPKLTAAGLRVFAFDLRGFGDSQAGTGTSAHSYGRDLRAAIDEARAAGARHVILIGASYGGAVALNFAPRLDESALISISGEATFPQANLNGLAAIPSLNVPLLIVGSRHDHWLPVTTARALIRRAGTRDKRLVLYPGSYHGWDIVEYAPYARDARATIVAWIRRHS